MRTMANYLIIMFSVMLFIFRLIVVFTATMGIEFMVQPINVNYEIALLFVMIISIILMSKNKLSGAVILVIASLAYYAPSLISQITYMSSNVINMELAMQTIISIICVVIPIFAFFIIAFAKEQEKRPVDKKTDFFYKTDRYDRQYDERADKNNYRTM